MEERFSSIGCQDGGLLGPLVDNAVIAYLAGQGRDGGGIFKCRMSGPQIAGLAISRVREGVTWGCRHSGAREGKAPWLKSALFFEASCAVILLSAAR